MLHENIDQKLFFLFTNAYEELYEKGEITVEQRNRILSLLENYKDFSSQEFQARLKQIFN